MMKSIKDGIVFSNDIVRIMQGNNALQFNYQEFCILPSDNFFRSLREDFYNSTSKIFGGKVTVIEEEEMLEGMYSSIQDVIGRYPHCILR